MVLLSGSPESDLLDVFGSEMTTEDQSFEELFEKFQRMKGMNNHIIFTNF